MITEFELDKCLPITTEQVKQIFTEGKVFEDELPYAGAVYATNVLRQYGWYIGVITDRPFAHLMMTEQWLYKHKFAWQMLELRKAKEKPDTASKQSIDVFVEDRLSTALELAKVCDTVFLMDRTWNKQDKLPDNVYRVYSWQEIVEKLINKE